MLEHLCRAAVAVKHPLIAPAACCAVNQLRAAPLVS